jgi:hypothetical protein
LSVLSISLPSQGNERPTGTVRQIDPRRDILLSTGYQVQADQPGSGRIRSEKSYRPHQPGIA